MQGCPSRRKLVIQVAWLQGTKQTQVPSFYFLIRQKRVSQNNTHAPYWTVGSVSHIFVLGMGEALFWVRFPDGLLPAGTNEPVYELPRIAYASQHMVLELTCLRFKSLQTKLGMLNLWPKIMIFFPLSVCTPFSTKRSPVSTERLLGIMKQVLSCADLCQLIQHMFNSTLLNLIFEQFHTLHC